MSGITQVAGTAVLIDRDNVDTDQIMPKQFCARTTRTGYENALFHGWRQTGDVPLDQDWAKRANVMLARENFGCGSSREHAVWGLVDYGFTAVIARSFADTFRSNCASNGLVAATVDAAGWDILTQVWNDDRDVEITIELDPARAVVNGTAVELEIPYIDRVLLASGKSQIELAQQFTDQVASYEQQRPTWMPRDAS